MKHTSIVTAAVVTAAVASAASAQPVVTNPGRCAQYYPDANCQNLGPGNPYTDGNWRNDWPPVRHAYRERHVYRHHPNHRG
jgi:hypothetical protein